MLHDLPVDIWLQIVCHISVTDLCNLRAASKALFNKLEHELIWKALYQTYFEMAVKAYQLDGLHFSSYRYDVMGFDRIRRQVELDIAEYDCSASQDPQLQFKRLRTIAKKYTLDERNIVALVLLHESRRTPLWDIASTLSLQKQAVVTNLILGCTFGIAIRRLLVHANNAASCDVNDLERFLNDTCLLDRCFHLFLGSRERKLQSLHQLLYRKFFTDIEDGGITGITISRTELTRKLLMRDQSVLQKYLDNMVSTILHSFHMDASGLDTYDRGRYLNESFLEDFSLPRIYAGVNKAHPDIINTLVGKIVSDFTATIDITVDNDENIGPKLPVNIRKGQLMIGPFIFIIRVSNDEHTKDYTFHSYKLPEYVMSLRTYLNNRHQDVMQYLSPTSMNQLIQMTLGLKLYGTYNSISTLATFRGNAKWFPIRYSEYEFNTSICQMFLSAKRGSWNTFDVPNLSIQLTNILKCFYVPVILDIAKPRKDNKCFHDLYEEIKWQSNYKDHDLAYMVPKNTALSNTSLVLDQSTFKFTVGSLAEDKRTHTCGVIIGFRKVFYLRAKDYCVVYTSRREIEVFNCEDVSIISGQNAMHEFLKEAGGDELALQYFSHVSDTEPCRLVPNCFLNLL